MKLTRLSDPGKGCSKIWPSRNAILRSSLPLTTVFPSVASVHAHLLPTVGSPDSRGLEPGGSVPPLLFQPRGYGHCMLSDMTSRSNPLTSARSLPRSLQHILGILLSSRSGSQLASSLVVASPTTFIHMAHSILYSRKAPLLN